MFLGTGGFSVSNNSLLFIEHSQIKESLHVKDKALISISAGSHLYFQKSNITNISPDTNILFVSVELSSNLTMIESVYENNYLSKHFEITGNSYIKIDKCYFKENSYRFAFMYSSIFSVTSSKLYVQRSTFYNNHLRHHIEFSVDVIILTYSSDVNMTRNVFITNPTKESPIFVLQMQPIG